MIDLEVLKQEIRGLTRRKKLFQVLKTELSSLGYWQNRPRGNPALGYQKGYGKNKYRVI